MSASYYLVPPTCYGTLSLLHQDPGKSPKSSDPENPEKGASGAKILHLKPPKRGPDGGQVMCQVPPKPGVRYDPRPPNIRSIRPRNGCRNVPESSRMKPPTIHPCIVVPHWIVVRHWYKVFRMPGVVSALHLNLLVTGLYVADLRDQEFVVVVDILRWQLQPDFMAQIRSLRLAMGVHNGGKTMYEYVGRFKAAKKRIQLLENALRMSGIPVPLRSDFLAEMLMGKELMGSGHAEVMCTKKHKIEE
ncbi:hypothetical protein POSPLADRAFT_1143944 [Postia placenta MAD-698-R-SB12]|uniref:Uncharacterized protein n=1 Tax=Postia placenta MAD-698-R-SB12 TaxID=670580 RepID=A0A1X6MYW4_9APHY|nr:hypothetical protein POSPLADRAFT_1143944 [Postia placenta MAD-698-R-SB12]OSX61440.1 hypothetical protein POSPLADRAFT_1143944 [Postia placenta MAD-698-R-SB12]